MKRSIPFPVSLLIPILFMMVTTVADSAPEILSAYLGVVNVPAANILDLTGCLPANSSEDLVDGMPVTFSVQLDPSTVSPDKFRVMTADGNIHIPVCANLEPADGPDENFTVLLSGSFADFKPILKGRSPGRPVQVSVVSAQDVIVENRLFGRFSRLRNALATWLGKGDDSEVGNDRLLSIDGEDLTGLVKDEITSGQIGPTLVLAHLMLNTTIDEMNNSVDQEQIQTVWEGGVTAINSGEPGNTELERIFLVDDDGNEFNPLGFQDLNDGDNFIVLDIPAAVRGDSIMEVKVLESTFYDPTNQPNPETSIAVTTFP